MAIAAVTRADILDLLFIGRSLSFKVFPKKISALEAHYLKSSSDDKDAPRIRRFQHAVALVDRAFNLSFNL